jgi:thymidylate synthase
MLQHWNNTSYREYKTEQNVDRINKLIDTLTNDNDALRFIIILRLFSFW